MYRQKYKLPQISHKPAFMVIQQGGTLGPSTIGLGLKCRTSVIPFYNVLVQDLIKGGM